MSARCNLGDIKEIKCMQKCRGQKLSFTVVVEKNRLQSQMTQDIETDHLGYHFPLQQRGRMFTSYAMFEPITLHCCQSHPDVVVTLLLGMQFYHSSTVQWHLPTHWNCFTSQQPKQRSLIFGQHDVSSRLSFSEHSSGCVTCILSGECEPLNRRSAF